MLHNVPDTELPTKPEKRIGRVLSFEAAPGGSDGVHLRDALELLRSCERAWQDLITKHVGPPPHRHRHHRCHGHVSGSGDRLPIPHRLVGQAHLVVQGHLSSMARTVSP